MNPDPQPEIVTPGGSDKTSWFTGPGGAKVGFFVGLFGLVFSVYSYRQTQLAPELTVAQQPVQTVIARSGEVSRLTVQYDGRELKADVNATQVAIWNAGNKAILAADILDSVLLSLDAPVEILEVSIRNVSRPVVSPSVKVIGVAKRFVHFGFKVLEPDDGAVVQITYAGTQGARIHVAGSVVGQKSIRIQSVASPQQNISTASSRSSRLATRILSVLGVGILSLITGFASYSMARYGYLSRSQAPAKRRTHIGQFITFLVIFLLSIPALVGLLVSGLGPPFSF